MWQTLVDAKMFQHFSVLLENTTKSYKLYKFSNHKQQFDGSTPQYLTPFLAKMGFWYQNELATPAISVQQNFNSMELR